MALPLRKPEAIVPDDLGPKIVPMPFHDVSDFDDSAAEEVEFVLRRASQAESQPSPLHDVAERFAATCDEAMQKIAAASAPRIDALRNAAQTDPLRFITIVAATGFVIGFGLRLLRSSRV